MIHPEISDLVVKARLGNKEVLADLVEHQDFYQMILIASQKQVPAQDAEDVAHDAFLVLWFRCHKMNFDDGIASLRGYIYKTVRTTYWKYLRKIHLPETKTISFESLSVVDDKAPDPYTKFYLRKVQEEIKLLPEQPRQAMEGWVDKPEIESLSQKLGVGNKAIYKRLKKARTLLKQRGL